MAAAYADELGASTLVKRDGTEVNVSAMEGKLMAMYFSASWCPPCRGFCPQLKKFYADHKDNHNFEIVFCSWDEEEEEFQEYFEEKHGDWLALPFKHRDSITRLVEKYKIETIPALIIVDPSGALVTPYARNQVVKDPEAKSFPWPEKPE